MTDFVRRKVGKAAPILAVFFCVAFVLPLGLDYTLDAKWANDFGVYWRTANAPLNEAYFWPGRFPFPYMPPMLLWISPLSLIPKWPAYFLFVAFSAIVFALACRPYLPKSALALALISPPFLHGLGTGQVSAAIAALLIWACGTGNRIAAGVAFGFIASVKPQLVIMAPLMMVFNRDGRAFLAAGATFVSIVLLSIIVLGAERWPEWIASMNHFHNAVVNTDVIKGGITPAAVAVRYGLPPLPFLLLAAIAGAGLVYLCRNMATLQKASAIAVGSLLAAPYALGYDLVTVVPFLSIAILGGRILPVLVFVAGTNPLPILVSAYELAREAVPMWRKGRRLAPA
jgi:hypothetical protein